MKQLWVVSRKLSGDFAASRFTSVEGEKFCYLSSLGRHQFNRENILQFTLLRNSFYQPVGDRAGKAA